MSATRTTAGIALLATLTAASVSAQEPDTRAQVLREQREAKQATAQPYDPNGLERAMNLAEGRFLPLLQRDGLYAQFGSLTTGSGFAFGGGYRDRSLVGRRGAASVWAAASLKKYWAIAADVSYPLLPGDTLTAEGYARRFAYPEEEYFGFGPSARRVDQTNYSLSSTVAGGRLRYRPMALVTTGGGVEYARPRIGAGASGVIPSTETLFDDRSAPGLLGERDFLQSSLFVEIDYRRPRNARKGGWYRLDVSHHNDRDAGAFSFTRVDVDLRQYVSVLAERRVFAGRVYLATTDTDAGSRVPFYLLPTLGGHDTLRGFRALRFRGPHAILLQGEYRWEIWSAFDAALFYDAGKVTERREDLSLDALERAYGIGFRFNTSDGVIMKIEAGFGSRDGRQIYVVFGGAF